MTRAERAFARRRYLLWICAVLLALAAAVIYTWHRVDTEATRADRLATEANLRGSAVSTLAGDVRALRQQVKAKGGTPVAPDPTKAVNNLGDRAQVPVPIPGPPGPKGDTGSTGKPAPTLTPSPGASGAPGAAGRPGSDSTIPGAAGPTGATGPAGRDGRDGSNGSPPTGWTYTDGAGVTYDCTPDGDGSTHYTCRAQSGTPAPAQPHGLLGLGLLTATASYRRLTA